jgi:hypothetical protein
LPSTGAQEDKIVPRPEVFRGSASSLVASVQVDREALLPVPELFRFIALDGSSMYESSTRQARASVLFPGNGLILGPSLACGTFGTQFPAEFKPILDTCLQYRYPLTVFADDFEPDGESVGSLALGAPTDPLSGTAVRAVAHAGEDAATTDAAMQDLRVLGLPAFGSVTPLLESLGVEGMDASLLTVESAMSRTHQRIVKGALVIDAEATMSGIRLVGGLLRIGNLRSVSHVTDDAKGARTAVASFELSGVTVGGIPAQITEDGLVIGEPAGGLGPIVEQVQAQLNEVLRAFQLTVTVLDSEESTDQDGAAVAAVGGLLVELSAPVESLPTIPVRDALDTVDRDGQIPLTDLDPNGTYVASLQFGATAARGAAFTFDPDAVDPDPPAFDGGGFVPGTDLDGGTGGGLELPEVAGAPVNPPAGGTQEAGGKLVVRSLDDLFGDRLGLVYLSLMFAVLGLCIAPRLFVPARLPGPDS